MQICRYRRGFNSSKYFDGSLLGTTTYMAMSTVYDNFTLNACHVSWSLQDVVTLMPLGWSTERRHNQVTWEDGLVHLPDIPPEPNDDSKR